MIFIRKILSKIFYYKMNEKIEDSFEFKKEILENIIEKKLISKKELINCFEEKVSLEGMDFMKFMRIKKKIMEI